MQIEFKKLNPLLKDYTVSPATKGSAGYDLYACIENSIDILPNETVSIPTGISFHIKYTNIAGLLLLRSSIGKSGLIMPHSVGLIDSDFQGEYLVLVQNQSKSVVTIKSMQRIAQLVFVSVVHPEFFEVTEFSETTERLGGFGSTDSICDVKNIV